MIFRKTGLAGRQGQSATGAGRGRSAARCLLPLALAATVLSSCGSDKQVSYNSGGVTQTFSDSDAASNNFPLPLYPNAKPAGAVDAKDGSEDNHFMMLTSDDSIEKVRDFYTQKLQADGWTVEPNSFGGGLTKLDAHKKGLEASVMLAVDNKQTSISLTVSNAEEGAPKLIGQPFTPDKMNPPTD